MKSLVATGIVGCLLGAWFGLQGVGCTVSSETTQPAGWPYPDAQSFCAKLAEFVCNEEVVRSCYGSDDASLVADTAACVDAFKADSACTPTVQYYPEHADDCLAAWQEAYEDGTLYPEDLEDMAERCLATFHDAGAAGDPCNADSDCDHAADLGCVVKEGDDAGTCQIPRTVGGGERCEGLDQVCPSGQFCDPSGFCHARPGLGEACAPEMPCIESALCGIETPDICGAKLANGDQCSADVQCSGGMCDKVSAAENGVCAASIRLYLQGAVCDMFQEP